MTASTGMETLPPPAQMLELPPLTTETFDALFVIKPSVLDGWVDNINSRTRSFIALSTINSPDVQVFSESVGDAIDLPDDQRTVLKAGMLYGKFLMKDSVGSDVEIDPDKSEMLIDAVKNVYASTVEGDARDRFAGLRSIEIYALQSDILATTLSAVQDHIQEIYPGGDRYSNQLKFYMGAVLGAIASRPNDYPNEPLMHLVLRDGYDAIGDGNRYDVPDVMTRRADDSATGIVGQALEGELAISPKVSSDFLRARNAREVQVDPNLFIPYHRSDSAEISRDKIQGAVVRISEGENVRYEVLNEVPADYTFGDEQTIIAIRAAGVRKRHPILYHAYHPAHPHHAAIKDALLEGVRPGGAVMVNGNGVADAATFARGYKKIPLSQKLMMTSTFAILIGSTYADGELDRWAPVYGVAALGILATAAISPIVDLRKVRKAQMQYVERETSKTYFDRDIVNVCKNHMLKAQISRKQTVKEPTHFSKQ